MTAREIVRSRSNPVFKRLRDGKTRALASRLVLVEGIRLLEEALAAGVRLQEAAVSESFWRAPSHRPLLDDLGARGVPLRVLADPLLQSLSEVETSQGVLALALPPRFELARLFAGTPFLLVACAIQNPGNLGGLLRTAEAAGASGALLSQGCADPLGWKCLRGSMGSAFRLPQLTGIEVAELVPRLRRGGVRTLAADARGGSRYDQVDWQGPLALLIGGEAMGVPEEVLREADERVAIPLAPPVESLNAGVAAGVLLFEAARQRRGERVLQSRAGAQSQ